MVIRTNRADRSQFWGCPTFPTCRGTRPYHAVEALRRDEPGPPIDGAVAWDDRRWATARAGGSARATYQRRLARHQDRTRPARPRILLIGVGLAVSGLAIVLTGSTSPLLGYALILVGILRTVTLLVETPASVRAWRIGAAGEERVGELLAALESEGCRVLHDRLVPGRRENIDHIVIGPFGVVVVESKHYAGPVSVRGGELHLKGRRQTSMVDQVERQLAAVREALDAAAVTGIICVIDGEFPILFAPRSVGGLILTSDRRLLERIRALPAMLDAAEIARLGFEAEHRFLPAAADPGASPGTAPSTGRQAGE
jgi:hypothetical protein